MNERGGIVLEIIGTKCEVEPAVMPFKQNSCFVSGTISPADGEKARKKLRKLHECSVCKECLPQEKYQPSQWKNRNHRVAKCMTCQVLSKSFWCKSCDKELGKHEFEISQWRHRGDEARETFCKGCSKMKEKRCCRVCLRFFPVTEFESSKAGERRFKTKCQLCSLNQQTHFCNGCERLLPKREFERSKWKNRGDLTSETLCVTCLLEKEGVNVLISLSRQVSEEVF